MYRYSIVKVVSVQTALNTGCKCSLVHNNYIVSMQALVYLHNVTCKLLHVASQVHTYATYCTFTLMNCRLVALHAVYCIQLTINSMTSVSRAMSYAKSKSAN